MKEANIIANYLAKLSKNNSPAMNLNDDVFFDKKNKLVVSIDTYNEGIHFFNFHNPELVVKKIIRSSISDLICKGVKPKYYFISAALTKNSLNKNNLNKIIMSLNSEQRKFKIKISGGDTTLSKNISFSITTIGFSNNIIERNKVKHLDDIYVTGNIGDSFIGLNILRKKIKKKKQIAKKIFYFKIL